jgi:hypothetical protein
VSRESPEPLDEPDEGFAVCLHRVLAFGPVGENEAFARSAARLVHDPDMLYRHIVPSAFRSGMGPGLLSPQTSAAIALALIRRGFRYVPVTYAGIAIVKSIPFFVRARHARSAVSMCHPSRPRRKDRRRELNIRQFDARESREIQVPSALRSL